MYPTEDSFYSSAGPLKDIEPGTPLKQRTGSVHLSGIPLPVKSTQILYRTNDELGRPSATVATLMRPPVELFSRPRLVSFQIAYDGLSPTCMPSYVLNGGGSTKVLDNLVATGEAAAMTTFLLRGYTVVTADYEGLEQHFAAGHEAAYGVLDGIRAAVEVAPELLPTTPIGLFGYSGGGIATGWANEFARSYAPELHIVGSAQGAFMPNMENNVRYAGNNPLWSVALAGGLVGLARAYDIDLSPYLSEKGMKLAQEVGEHCIGDWFVRGLGGNITTMFKAEYADVMSIPVARKITEDQTMGQHTPVAPTYMAVGNYDGTGDGIMLAADIRALAEEYCDAGLQVRYDQLVGDHFVALAGFSPAAISWLHKLLAGKPVEDNCD